MIRRPPRSTQSRSSAASDVYKRQVLLNGRVSSGSRPLVPELRRPRSPVSYTHLRAHETRHDLVCRLLLEKKTEGSGIWQPDFDTVLHGIEPLQQSGRR